MDKGFYLINKIIDSLCHIGCRIVCFFNLQDLRPLLADKLHKISPPFIVKLPKISKYQNFIREPCGDFFLRRLKKTQNVLSSHCDKRGFVIQKSYHPNNNRFSQLLVILSPALELPDGGIAIFATDRAGAGYVPIKLVKQALSSAIDKETIFPCVERSFANAQ